MSSSTMLITGTSRGIGKAVAEHFAARGLVVIGCSRSPSTIDQPNYHHHCVDLTVEDQVRRFSRLLKADYGRVDILVANVGLADLSVFTTVLPATGSGLYRSFVDTNLTSTFYICREVSKLMIRQRFGRILTISSLAAIIHQPGTAIYAATKAAVIEMTKVMARELAPYGITCNSLAPGLVDTELAKTVDDEWRQRMLNHQTNQQATSTDELCHAINFLTARECAYLTGQVLIVGAIG